MRLKAPVNCLANVYKKRYVCVMKFKNTMNKEKTLKSETGTNTYESEDGTAEKRGEENTVQNI